MGVTINRANKILTREWGGNNDPATWYMILSTSPINKDGSGVREPVIGVGGYARAIIPNTSGVDGVFGTAVNAKVSNIKEIAFNYFSSDLSVPGVTGNIIVTHWALCTSSTSVVASDVAYYGELKKSRIIQGDSQLSFKTGDVILEIEMPAT